MNNFFLLCLPKLENNTNLIKYNSLSFLLSLCTECWEYRRTMIVSEDQRFLPYPHQRRLLVKNGPLIINHYSYSCTVNKNDSLFWLIQSLVISSITMRQEFFQSIQSSSCYSTLFYRNPLPKASLCSGKVALVKACVCSSSHEVLPWPAPVQLQNNINNKYMALKIYFILLNILAMKIFSKIVLT